MNRAEYEIRPEQLAEKLQSKVPFVLLDVRRHDEVATAALAGHVHIPIDEIEERVSELEPSAEIVVYCHHGVRSLSVTVFLRNQGFHNVTSLAGGIDLWSQRVDPSVPRY